MPLDPWSDVADCVVLGAGIAGVTAARNLGAMGHEVVVLDALDRVGGRMHSRRDWTQGVADPGAWPLEAGAEYIHIWHEAARYKEFFDELRRLNFRWASYPKWEGAGHNRVWFPGWDEPRDLISTMTSDCDIYDMSGIISEIDSYNKATDIGVGAFAASKKFKGLGVPMSRYALSAHTPGVLDGTRDDISVLGMKADRLPSQLMQRGEWKLLDSQRRLCGYDRLPRVISDQFLAPASAIARPGVLLLGHRVASVTLAPGGGVIVKVQGKPGEIRARACVSTLPVGVLGSPAGPAIFGPLLTQRKRDALKVVRMGAITKFSLQFKRRLWPFADMTVLSNPTGKARTFFSSFPGTNAAQGPHVLTGLLMGVDHEIISAMSDDQAWRHLLGEIERVLRQPGDGPWTAESVLVGTGSGTTFIPNFLRTDWASLDLFGGGNSYIRYSPTSPVRPDQARRILADESDSLPVFWAGEATAPTYRDRYQPLAVHGAYISGVGVAGRVDQYLRSAPIPMMGALTLGTMVGAPSSANARTSKRALKKKVSKKASKNTGKKGAKAPDAPAEDRPRATPPRTLTIKLQGEELETLRRYALLRHRGKHDAAATELLKVFLRSFVQQSVP